MVTLCIDQLTDLVDRLGSQRDGPSRRLRLDVVEIEQLLHDASIPRPEFALSR